MIECNTLALAVEGYPGRLSYSPGEEVAFHCTARTRTFTAEVARIGAGREPVWRREGIPGAQQAVPDEASARGCGWTVSFTLTIPDTWRSGFYEVALKGEGVDGPESTSHAFFVVRSAQPGRDTGTLLVLGTNTYNAYNKWGGACLYTGSPGSRSIGRSSAATSSSRSIPMASMAARPTSRWIRIRITDATKPISASTSSPCGAIRAAGTTGSGASFAGRRPAASPSTTPPTPTLSFGPRFSTGIA